MQLITIAFIAHTQHVVRGGSHCEVVGADDSLIVVGQGDAPHLSEDSHLGRQLHPAFIEIQRTVSIHAPYGIILYNGMCLQQGRPFPRCVILTPPFKIDNQSCTSLQETGTVLYGCLVTHLSGQASRQQLAVGQEIQTHVQLVQLRRVVRYR